MSLTPHIPQDPNESFRWQFTRQARHLLEGDWANMLIQYMGKQLSAQRLHMVGQPVTSLNLFKNIVKQLAIQYYNPLTVSNSNMSAEQEAQLQTLLETVSLHSLQKKNSEYVIGLRESFICIKVDSKKDKNVISLEIVTPDMVICHTDSSGELVYFKRAIFIQLNNQYIKAWEEYSLLGSKPTYKIIYADKDIDITSRVHPEGFLDIRGYPFYNEEGFAFIPVVKYRAETTNDEFNPYAFKELVTGTFDIAADWTYWNRIVRDASWPQRYILNAQPAGLTNTQNGANASVNVATVPTDPTSIMILESEDGKQVNIGQWQPGGDPEKLATSIETFQASIIRAAGIHAEDMQTTQSSSGIAISLKRSSQRRLAHQYIEEFRKADLDLLYKLATVYNEYDQRRTSKIPTTGYTLQYNLPQASPEEIQSELNVQLGAINAGLASKVDVYMQLNPGMTREDAKRHLDRIKEENALY